MKGGQGWNDFYSLLQSICIESSHISDVILGAGNTVMDERGPLSTESSHLRREKEAITKQYSR